MTRSRTSSSPSRPTSDRASRLGKAAAGLAAALVVWAALAVPAAAQQGGPAISFAPQVLALDQDRLFEETLYGQRIRLQVDMISTELAELNRKVSAELAAEEQALTERRATMPQTEFRALASAFDEKVTRLREEQDSRILDLQRRRDLERRGFTARVAPILLEIVQTSGAVAILDERAVILAADAIDVTDEAIARVDRLLGDGSLQTQGLGAPTEAPAAASETPTDGEADTSPEQPDGAIDPALPE